MKFTAIFTMINNMINNKQNTFIVVKQLRFEIISALCGIKLRKSLIFHFSINSQSKVNFVKHTTIF